MSTFNSKRQKSNQTSKLKEGLEKFNLKKKLLNIFSQTIHMASLTITSTYD